MKTISLLFVLAFILINPFTLLAQHDHHPAQKKETSKLVAKPDTSMPKIKMEEHAMMDTMPMMTHSYSLNLPMSRK